MSTLSSAPFAEPLYLTRPLSSPYYTASHRHLQSEVRAYVSEHITPHCADWEAAGSIPTSSMQLHAKLGYTAVAIYPLAPSTFLRNQRLPGGIKPEDWDGFHDLVVIDEIARCGYLGVVWGLSCGNAVGVPPLINFGSEEQRKKWLPGILGGRERWCLGITEPGAGSDVANISTTAVRDRSGSHYIVNGAKKWITNGLWCQYMTAAVRTSDTSGRHGISALVIPLNLPGITRRRLHNSGVASSGSTFFEFEDVKVPVGNLIGGENKGFDILMSNFNHERIWLAATALRLARVSAGDAYEYACIRETFGKRLIENQVISAKVAGFGARVESVQALLEQVVFLVDRIRVRGKKEQKGQGGAAMTREGEVSVTTAGLEDGEEYNVGGLIAMVKVAAGRALESVNRDAQQILGGAGYNRAGKGVRIEQISRDVRILCVGGGSEEILEDLVVRIETRELERLVGLKKKGGGPEAKL